MHSIEVDGCVKVHVFAVVEWFKKSDETLDYSMAEESAK